MKCQFCSNEATFHLYVFKQKQLRELNVCDACAREKNLTKPAPEEINIQAIVQSELLTHAFGQMNLTPPTAEPSATAVCPECGMPYAHFRAQGRLGCPHDYEAFRALLEPLLERVHSNGLRHIGKVPNRQQRRLRKARRVELEAQLRSAVAAERYEDAARLRDEIRHLGADHEL